MSNVPAIGIDLGTTFSCVSVFKDGEVKIIPNEYGNRTTPSYVAFTEHERLIGQAAYDQVGLNSRNSVFDAKRLIGRTFDDEVVQEDVKNWSFQVINDDGKPKIRVDFKGEIRDFFPEEISAMVLVKMKEIAESYLGQEVTKAVITVPAYFNDSQRQATKDAGAIAGLNVMKIINEPTAAAIAFGLIKEDGERNVLIYDFGGGTFDVSVLRIKDKEIVVKSTGGDTHLGGEDLDHRLLDHFVEEFLLKHKKDMTTNAKSLRRLRCEVEKAKRTLSSSMKTTVQVDCLFDGIDFRSTITRVELVEMCSDLFQLTMTHVEKALEDAKMKKSAINDIVLVGGSSRIPQVQLMLEEFFDRKDLVRSINMDEAVAQGAAIQAAILNGLKDPSLNRLSLQDVTPLSLGINEVGNIVDIFIPRNSPIPITRVRKWTTTEDYQTVLNIMVCEGERPMVEDNHVLGEITLKGITPAPKEIPTFLVTLTIDVNGILSASVKDESIGTINDIEVSHEKGRLTQEEITRMIEDSNKYKVQDMKEKERVKTFLRVQEYCLDTKTAMNHHKHVKIPQMYRQVVIDACDDLIKWLNHNKKSSKKVIEEKEKSLKVICLPTLNMMSK